MEITASILNQINTFRYTNMTIDHCYFRPLLSFEKIPDFTKVGEQWAELCIMGCFWVNQHFYYAFAKNQEIWGDVMNRDWSSISL